MRRLLIDIDNRRIRTQAMTYLNPMMYKVSLIAFESLQGAHQHCLTSGNCAGDQTY
jgi:hypothetical protein